MGRLKSSFFHDSKYAILQIGDSMDKKEYRRVFIGSILNCLTDKIPSDIILKKNNKIGVVTKISPSIIDGNFSINKYLNHEEYNSVLIKFSKVLETDLYYCEENAFRKNIKTLSIQEILLTKRERLFSKLSDATYNGMLNEIKIYGRKNQRIYDEETKREKEDKLTHELLHMASCYKKGIVLLMGFKQSFNNKHSIGNGINEGYTELLNIRYFTKNPSRIYPEQQLIAKGIENIVGQKKMEKLYFSADLKGLINEIGKYCSIEQALNLIKKIDHCHKLEEEDYEKYREVSKEIKSEIYDIFVKKQQGLLENGQITRQEYETSVFDMQDYKQEKTSAEELNDMFKEPKEDSYKDNKK